MKPTTKEAREALARVLVLSRNAPMTASAEWWPGAVAHYYEMCADWPEYANGRSLVTDAFRSADAVLEYLAADAGPGWRSIDDAPRDGTEIDLWGRVRGSSHRGYRVPECTWRVLADGPDWYTRGEKGWECLGAIGWKPTHWMPLPAAPAPDAKEEG